MSAIFTGGVVTRALIVSIGITAVGTLLSLFVTTMLALRAVPPGHRSGSRLLLLPGTGQPAVQPGIIPNYLVVKQLGLLEHVLGAHPARRDLSAFNVIVMRRSSWASRRSSSTARGSTAPATWKMFW